MFSRRAIFRFSLVVALAAYALLLWVAPRVTLLEADRVAKRINTRFRVELADAPPERRSPAPQEREPGAGMRDVEALFTQDPGELAIGDSLETPPVATPQVHERTATESLERAYDLAPQPERARKLDARILEIAAADARRDVNISRRLVRPGPDYALPVEALPALRSRDMAPGDIPLEPARMGVGLLAQTTPLPDDAPPDGGDGTLPPFEPGAMEPGAGGLSLNTHIATAPVEREAQKAREESAYAFMDDMVDIRLETYVAAPDEPGYFRLRIQPRSGAALTPLPRDIVFVVDASRSVQQRKLDLMARGVSDVLDRFRPEDRFNILLFRDTVTHFRQEPVFATPETVAAARAFLNGVESRGQTDIYNALLPIAQITPRTNLPGIVVVVSDGVPTTGIRDSRAIINAITADNALRNSVFAYGAGSTVNRYLMDLLAYRNKGAAFVSDNIQNARGDIAAFVDRLSFPLLVNLRTEYGRTVRGDVYPQNVPDFYRDVPIVLHGRFEPGTDEVFAARITGYGGDQRKELVFRVALSEAERGGRDIAQGWGFQHAYHLIGEISRRGEEPELLEELRQVSAKYGIRTIYE